MKRTTLILAVSTLALLMAGCHIGESTAPKPDPAQFLPKGKSAAGPPPSSPSSK